MQTLEAIISLFMFMSFITLVASEWHVPVEIDSSLYKHQLANDVWRVLYLRGDFTGFSFEAANAARIKAELDVHTIGELTSHCIFVGGERITNCRGEPVQRVVSTERVTLVNGNPEKITVTLATKE